MTRRSPIFREATGNPWKRRRRESGQSDVDITPMIDVTFLLLIFFMVTSTMRPPAGPDVPPAEHGVGADTLDATIISVRREGVAGGEPTIVLGSRPGTLDDVRAYVENGVERGKSHVIINADRDVPHGFVQRVARAVNEVDDATFSIGVQDKERRR